MDKLLRARIAVDSAVLDCRKALPMVFFVVFVIGVVGCFAQSLINLDAAETTVRAAGNDIYKFIKIVGAVAGIGFIAWEVVTGIMSQQLGQKLMGIISTIIGVIILFLALAIYENIIRAATGDSTFRVTN